MSKTKTNLSEPLGEHDSVKFRLGNRCFHVFGGEGGTLRVMSYGKSTGKLFVIPSSHNSIDLTTENPGRDDAQS